MLLITFSNNVSLKKCSKFPQITQNKVSDWQKLAGLYKIKAQTAKTVRKRIFISEVVAFLSLSCKLNKKSTFMKLF